MTLRHLFGIEATLLVLFFCATGEGLAAQDCTFGNDDMDDIQRIRGCMEGSTAADWPGVDGSFTMLHRAARYTSNPAVVSVILEVGFDPNGKTDSGWTALHYAARYNANSAVSSILLDAGSDPNQSNNFGLTPLHLAVSVGNRTVVSILLAAGADPNRSKNDGETPLHMAVEEVDRTVLSILLDAGADLNRRNSNGEAPLHRALREGDPSIVSLLLDAGADATARIYHDEDWTPLHLAAVTDQPVLVTMLLGAGADPLAKSDDGRTPLHSAVYFTANQAVVSALLDVGAGAGLTPFHLAALTGDGVALTVAVVRGADPNATDDYGWTPLHFAALAGRWGDSSANTISDLVDAGADLNAMDRHGMTPLGLVSEYGGKVSSVTALLDAGAVAEPEFGPYQQRATHGVARDLLVDVGMPETGEVFRECAGCPDMVVVPAGSFMMGSPDEEAGRYEDEGPQQRVTIHSRIAVGVYEVTFAEWETCALSGGCRAHWPGDAGWGRGDRPVVNVNWEDAQAYVQWLSTETGQQYRLLSEAEWEYVARAGTQTARHWGGSDSGQCQYANGADAAALAEYPDWTTISCNDGYIRTAPVGLFQPNGFGLYDVLGNVWEWTQDCWNASYSGAPTDGSAWSSGDCSLRVLRGGSWLSAPGNLRSAYRYGDSAESRDSVSGFRVARTLN